MAYKKGKLFFSVMKKTEEEIDKRSAFKGREVALQWERKIL